MRNNKFKDDKPTKELQKNSETENDKPKFEKYNGEDYDQDTLEETQQFYGTCVTLIETPETDSVDKAISDLRSKYLGWIILTMFANLAILILGIIFATTKDDYVMLAMAPIVFLIIILCWSKYFHEMHLLNTLKEIAQDNDEIRHKERIKFIERERLAKQKHNIKIEYEEKMKNAEQVHENPDFTLPKRPPKDN